MRAVAERWFRARPAASAALEPAFSRLDPETVPEPGFGSREGADARLPLRRSTAGAAPPARR
jgi:hypothetical protein